MGAGDGTVGDEHVVVPGADEGAGEVAGDYDVYLGFQLDAGQLEYNRRRRAR